MEPSFLLLLTPKPNHNFLRLIFAGRLKISTTRVRIIVLLISRSFRLAFHKEVEFEEISTNVFKLHPETFGEGKIMDDNACTSKDNVDDYRDYGLLGLLPMDKCFGGNSVAQLGWKYFNMLNRQSSVHLM